MPSPVSTVSFILLRMCQWNVTLTSCWCPQWGNKLIAMTFTVSQLLSICPSGCPPVESQYVTEITWLLELDVMLAQGYWLQESFIKENCGKYINWILDSHRETQKGSVKSFAKFWQRWHAFFPFRNVHSCKRSGQNVHGPFSPEHISSNVPSVFFLQEEMKSQKAQ